MWYIWPWLFSFAILFAASCYEASHDLLSPSWLCSVSEKGRAAEVVQCFVFYLFYMVLYNAELITFFDWRNLNPTFSVFTVLYYFKWKIFRAELLLKCTIVSSFHFKQQGQDDKQASNWQRNRFLFKELPMNVTVMRASLSSLSMGHDSFGRPC